MTPQDLVDSLLAQPWGQVSPSIYETGRVVSLTPWLIGHDTRVSFLLDAQNPNGSWGPREPGYALVPTLSAVEALLTESARRPGEAAPRASAERGLRILRGWLGALPPLPDMPAIELIGASLVTAINAVVAEPLPLPRALDDGMLALVREAFGRGAEVPEKLMHALEILGPDAARLPGVQAQNTGTVGASPAATAAWLGAQEPGRYDRSRRFLETAVRLGGGPVPCGLPITVFERGWVLIALIRAGLKVDPHPELVLSLAGSLGPAGTPAAAGLPADADTTAGALHALTLLGVPTAPDMLWTYEGETHFNTWPGEQGRSVSTNAHVLEAFGAYARLYPSARYAQTIRKVSAWLVAQQRADGSWLDRWHISPFYATVSVVLALRDHGGPVAEDALRRAVAWVLGAQRADGSWGAWGGTAEETAYALQILRAADGLLENSSGDSEEAVGRGAEYLDSHRDDHSPLWHDKDLYLPLAIVQANVLAARHLALGPVVAG